ncbi:MAG: DUF6291 domain-containing protein [Eubacteriales bacterium]
MGKPRNQFTFYKSYYDAIQELPKRDQSALILAICAYAIYETPPKSLSIAASTAFKLIKPTLDSGRKKAENGALGGQANGKQSESKREANEKQSESKREANRKQGESAREKEWEKEKELEIEYEVEEEGEGNSLAADDGDCDDGYNELKIMGGLLGRGVVKLSRAQSDALLDKLGLEMFNYYVSRLADYIIESGAVIHNHYETIIKWWTEDGKI